MPFVGDFSPFDSNEKVALSVDLSSAMAAGDSFTSIVSIAISAYLGSDPNASSIFYSSTFTGNVVTVVIGPGGIPAVTYRVTIVYLTAQNSQLSAYAHIFCAPVN